MVVSVFFMIVTFPFSLLFVIKVHTCCLVLAMTRINLCVLNIFDKTTHQYWASRSLSVVHFIYQVIPQYERAVVFRLGRIKGGQEQPPGMLLLLPCLDQIERVDTRLKTFDVPPQKVSFF